MPGPLAVVATGSIRAAAKHLGLGQPALSRSLRDLEQELGIPLLERRAGEEIAQHRGDVRGGITVFLSSLSHLALLPYARPSFTRRYPRVVISVAEGPYPMVA